jgi:signal transduction histidine kinase
MTDLGLEFQQIPYQSFLLDSRLKDSFSNAVAKRFLFIISESKIYISTSQSGIWSESVFKSVSLNSRHLGKLVLNAEGRASGSKELPSTFFHKIGGEGRVFTYTQGGQWEGVWICPLFEGVSLQGYYGVVLKQSYWKELLSHQLMSYPDLWFDISGLGENYQIRNQEGEQSQEYGKRRFTPGKWFSSVVIDIRFPLNWEQSKEASFDAAAAAYFFERTRRLSHILPVPLLLLFLGFLLFYWKMRDTQKLIHIQSDWIDYLSHELQTPVHSLGVLQELNMDEEAKKKMGEQRLHHLIRSELARLSEILRVFTMAAREQKKAPYPENPLCLDLVKIVRSAMDTVSTIHYGKSPEISCMAPDVAELIGYKEILHSIFINILDNSCKYCRQNPKIDISIKVENQCIVVRLDDNGVGIAPGEENKVFRPFYRSLTFATEGVQGCGLGLSTVRNGMDAHYGSVCINNRDDMSGVSVTLIFPLEHKGH